MSSTKVVIITGAARRIGRAIAVAMANDGWNVAIHYGRSGAEAKELVEAIEKSGRRAMALQADLNVSAQVATLVPRCTENLGPPTCLINSASQFLNDCVDALTEQLWDQHFNVNLKTPVFLARDLSKHLPAGTQGNVINIIDQRVWRLTPDFFSYTVSKSGLWAATRMLAQALAPNVRVNAIGPGPVLKSIHQSDADFAEESEGTLLGHGPTPEEIASAVKFILETSSMTGQMIALDGGQHLAWSQPPTDPNTRTTRFRR